MHLKDLDIIVTAPPPPAGAGGIWEAKKIAAIAELHNALVAPHLYAGPIEWAANVLLGASIPNLHMVETIEQGGDFHLALIDNTIRWEEGFAITPDAPGLGINPDEDLMRAHPYTGDGLHLEMQEAPCSYTEENCSEGDAPAPKDDRGSAVRQERLSVLQMPRHQLFLALAVGRESSELGGIVAVS